MTKKSAMGIMFMVALVTVGTASMLQLLPQPESVYARLIRVPLNLDEGKVPIATSGDNIYLAWWTNNTANNNEEVMFRASTDSGATFGDKINLSNTTDAGSTRAEIAGEEDNVIVSWWETNQTSDTPVARISTDSGQTFGPTLMLDSNGTIGEAEQEPAEGE